MYVEYLNSKPMSVETENTDKYVHTEIIYQEDESDKIDEEARQLELQNAILDIFGVDRDSINGTNYQSEDCIQKSNEIVTSNDYMEDEASTLDENVKIDYMNTSAEEANSPENLEANDIISEGPIQQKTHNNESEVTQQANVKAEDTPAKIRKRPRPKRNI